MSGFKGIQAFRISSFIFDLRITRSSQNVNLTNLHSPTSCFNLNLSSQPTHPISPSYRLNSTSSTSYPSGSVRSPTKIILSSSTSLSQAVPNRLSSISVPIPLAHRKLPDLPNRKPFYILTFLAIASTWASFVYFSTNAEKANSSVVKAVLFELRTNPISRDALGDSIREQKDDFFGQLWVNGQINLMQGAVDVAFRVTGSKVRWKLIRDDGVIFDLSQQPAPDFYTGDGTSTLIKPPITSELDRHNSIGTQRVDLGSRPTSSGRLI